MKEFRDKYDWDPVQVLEDKVKDDFFALRMQGRSDRDIQIMFKDDPFIKIGAIMKQVRKIDEANQEKDDLALKKAMHEYTNGKLYK